MLSHITIRNFQSLSDVAVELKPFTVIVGPSSSGKSAFTRALRTLTSNQRGDSFITHGETQTVIKAKTDKGTVALLRGKKNEYVIIPEDDPTQQKTYTKLAGNTPEEVSEFIGIPAKDPLNYSNQFDMPYLLTSSAAEVARTLGELTNVSVIFEASREANRQRLQASSTLKTRAADYEALTANLDKYRNLKQNAAYLTEAEEVLSRAREVQTRISRVEQLLTSIRDIPEVPQVEVPDLESLVEKNKRVQRLDKIITQHARASETYSTASKRVASQQEMVQSLEAQYTQTLRDEGACPTCGQSTEHVH